MTATTGGASARESGAAAAGATPRRVALGRPTRLDGSARTDHLMSTLVGVVGVYRRLSQFSGRRRPPVRVVDRDLSLVVETIRPEAEGVVSLRLANGRPLPAWRPGAHVDLVLPSGLTRQYSLCGDPADRSHYRIAVRKIGAASAEVHAFRPGQGLTVRGPRTAFPFVGDGPFLFVAGGIGITPILPMVRQAVANGADWRLVYTGRSRASMPFLGELPDDDRVRIRPDTEYGIPASGAELLAGMPAHASVYCCGPVPMITGVRVDLALTTAAAVHFERFAPPPIVAGRPFRLTLRRSGTVLEVPGDRSALDVLRDARPGTPYSCRQGFCGTCAVPTADGGSMRVCVDRGATVLDL